jgi:hypothetical protein
VSGAYAAPTAGLLFVKTKQLRDGASSSRWSSVRQSPTAANRGEIFMLGFNRWHLSIVLSAASNVVLVRKDIHPAIIDLLARAIMETHGKPGPFQQAGEFPIRNIPFPRPRSISTRTARRS